jgi:hypothetical protein
VGVFGYIRTSSLPVGFLAVTRTNDYRRGNFRTPCINIRNMGGNTNYGTNRGHNKNYKQHRTTIEKDENSFELFSIFFGS